MNPTPDPAGNDAGEDNATFARLPKKTKELMRLKQQNEKAIGQEQAATTRKIEKKARNASS